MMELHELINIFLYELDEELEEYSDSLVDLEESPSNVQLLEDLYVNVHTIKGSSKALLNSMKKSNYEHTEIINQIANLTHKFEDYLDTLKHNSLIDAESLAYLSDFLLLIHELKNALTSKSSISSLDKISDFIHSLANSVNDGGITLINDNSNSKHFFRISLNFDAPEDEIYKHGYLNIIYREIEDVYPNCIHNPTKEELLKGEDFENITLQISSEDMTETIKSYIESIQNVGGVEIIPYKVGNNSTKEQPKTTIKEIISSYSEVTPLNNIDEKKKLSQPLRIETKRIDNVLKHTSKLVILKNKLDQFLLQNDFLAGTKKRKELESIFNEINVHVDYLQESVLEIRMTPFQQLFTRFPHDIRALSKEAGKPIKFNTYGGTTEIDKSILDELFEPFMHLIRNSLIHGIESPDIRVKKGKPPEGNITIQAKHDKNRVIITISDDGKGIDLDTVKEVAINRHIVSEIQAQNMDKNELLELIFKSGVSTSKEVTEYSGRGIGMDAVRKKIEAINGSISVMSQDDIGTTVTLYLPLTTAIIDGMITKINGDYFTFPISQVEEVINIHKSEIRTSSDKSFFFLKDREIPIIFAEEFFNLDENNESDNPFIKIMVLRSQNYTIGLTIDEFLGQQSIVVKSMHPFIQRARGISSCNILGDGSISLIIDANDLLPFLTKS